MVVAAALCALGLTSTSIAFEPSMEPFPNPGRGWHGWASDLSDAQPGDLQHEFQSGRRLVRSVVRLDEFRNAPISHQKLAALDAGFDRLRDAGLKVILRFVYNFPTDETDYHDAQDASLETVLGHIDQLEPIFAENRDVIAVLHAGFIGSWGEWHTSSSGLDTPETKRRLVDALNAVLRGVPVHVRYPDDVQAWNPDPTEATVGFHNDCWLSGPTDIGTFEGGMTDPLRDFAQRWGRAKGFGAETCSAYDAVRRYDCDSFLAEAEAFGLQYLNVHYAMPFVDSVRREGCFDEAAAKMGERWTLVELTAPNSARPGEVASVKLTVRNDGWAQPFGFDRRVRVWMGETPIDVATLPRLAPGEEQTLELEVPVPDVAGDWPIALSFPDPFDSLASDPRYDFRPGNANGEVSFWQPEAERWQTGASILVR